MEQNSGTLTLRYLLQSMIEALIFEAVFLYRSLWYPTSFPYDFLKGIDLKQYDTTGYIVMTTFARVKPENVAALKKALEHEEATMSHEAYDAETGEKIDITYTEQQIF